MIYSSDMLRAKLGDTDHTKETEKESSFRMELDSRAENEAFARTVIAAFMTRLDPTVEEMNDVKTAISEAVTNSIIHGYPNRDGRIILEAALKGEELTVSIIDYGEGIENIAQALEPMYSGNPQLERSGMGFSFMEVFMDSLYVESKKQQGTTVTMTKRINGKRH